MKDSLLKRVLFKMAFNAEQRVSLNNTIIGKPLVRLLNTIEYGIVSDLLTDDQTADLKRFGTELETRFFDVFHTNYEHNKNTGDAVSLLDFKLKLKSVMAALGLSLTQNRDYIDNYNRQMDEGINAIAATLQDMITRVWNHQIWSDAIQIQLDAMHSDDSSGSQESGIFQNESINFALIRISFER